MGNVHVSSLYGKIERKAGVGVGGVRGGEFYFLPSAFHYFQFPIHTKHHRSQQNSGAE